MEGQAWAEELDEQPGPRWDSAVLEALRAGHFTVAPFVPLKIEHRDHEIVLFVGERPLAIGTERPIYWGGFSAPLWQEAATVLGLIMPTPLVLDRIFRAADFVLGIHNQPSRRERRKAEGFSPRSSDRDAIIRHAHDIADDAGDQAGLGAPWGKAHVLSLGSWKRPGMTRIYGWQSDHSALARSVGALEGVRCVQGLNRQTREPYGGHVRDFRNYPYPLIPISAGCLIDGQTAPTAQLYTGPLAGAVSHEGPLPGAMLPGASELRSAKAISIPAPAPEPAEAPALKVRRLRVTKAGDPIIARGWTDADSAGAVSRWQQILIGVGLDLSPYGADGDFGKLTHERTRTFQLSHSLKPDGIVGGKTWAASKIEGWPSTGRPLPLPIAGGDWPPKPKVAELKPLVGTQARQSIFGAFRFESTPTASNPEAITIRDNWGLRNILQVKIPQLAGVRGAPRDCLVPFHQLVAGQLVDLFAAWEREGLIKLVHAWAGSWVPRYIRGSRSVLSNHAFGTAFDLNAPWNPLGAKPKALDEYGSVRELVPLANAHGFWWGGHFSRRPDGMHFEAAKLIGG